MARHPNQKIPTYCPKKTSEDLYENVEYLIQPNIPQYILKSYKYNKEVKNYEM